MASVGVFLLIVFLVVAGGAAAAAALALLSVPLFMLASPVTLLHSWWKRRALMREPLAAELGRLCGARPSTLTPGALSFMWDGWSVEVGMARPRVLKRLPTEPSVTAWFVSVARVPWGATLALEIGGDRLYPTDWSRLGGRPGGWVRAVATDDAVRRAARHLLELSTVRHLRVFGDGSLLVQCDREEERAEEVLAHVENVLILAQALADLSLREEHRLLLPRPRLAAEGMAGSSVAVPVRFSG